MMNEQAKPWKIIFKGTIAEGYACPYCGKRGYGNEDRCDYCGKKVKPPRDMR